MLSGVSFVITVSTRYSYSSMLYIHNHHLSYFLFSILYPGFELSCLSILFHYKDRLYFLLIYFTYRPSGHFQMKV